MSLRLRLLSLALRVFVKPLLAHAAKPEANRDLMIRGARRVFRAPPFALYRETRLTPDIRALWVCARPATRPVAPDRIVLYIHGGGFIAGAPETHAPMLARLGWLSGVEICAPEYRLSPEHAFPKALEDVRAAWDALVTRGYRPEHIVLAGDSAGGNLALALLADLCAEAQRPAGLVAIAPLTDFTFQGASMRDNEARDAMLPARRRDDVATWYLAGADPTDPRASPFFAKFDAPPPVLLQYAETEILRDDARRMAEVLRTAGGAVNEHAWPDAPHVFQIFDGWVPEARESLREIADFVTERLAIAPR